MKSSGLSAITLVPLLMAVFSLLSMMGMFQINRIVQQDLYRYGLQFSMRWAKPYWDVSVFVFAIGWFNIVLAVAFELYVITYGRREAKKFAAEVKKEIVNIETKSTEKAEEQTSQSLTPSETQEKTQKETPVPVTESESSQKKEEPQQVLNVDQKGKEQVTPDQPAQSEKKEETPIIVGLTEEELQTSS